MMLTVIFEEPFYRKESFFITNAYDVKEQETIIVKGNLEVVPVDQEVTITGEWKSHPKFGNQFVLTSIIFDSDTDAMVALLGSGLISYVGPATAKKIVNAFGDQTFSILNAAVNDLSAQSRLLSVHGIGLSNISNILDDWKEKGETIMSMLVGVKAGLSTRQAEKARKEFGANLERVIIEEPYRLMIVPGIGWETADMVAQREWQGKVAIHHDSPYRHAAAVRAILDKKAKEGGHTLYPYSQTSQMACAMAGLRYINPESFEKMGVVELEGSVRYLTTIQRYRAESNILQEVHRLISQPIVLTEEQLESVKDIDQFSSKPLAEKQIAAIRQALTSSISIITGGPGTGKTFTLSVLLNILMYLNKDFTLCAPTGKAARRMSEATGHPASTIHSILGLHDDFRAEDFQTDFILVDEASMKDVGIMRMVLSAVGETSHIVLIGDMDQLPPVGAGEPFSDLISSDIPSTHLDVIHRQGENSGIVHLCHAIMRGDTSPLKNSYHDLNIVRVQSNDDLVQHVSSFAEVSHPDIQYLTPINGTEAGQISLNKILREICNPGRNPVDGFDFRPGDRVIHTVNNYELGVMNGEVGEVLEVGESLYLDSPVHEEEDDYDEGAFEELYKDNEEVKTPSIGLLVKYGDRTVGYTRTDALELQFAWAITIHKSQGSEYDDMALVLPYTNDSFMLRQLLYTGLSRGKKHVTIFSPRGALEKHILNETRVRRHTILKELLRVQQYA